MAQLNLKKSSIPAFGQRVLRSFNVVKTPSAPTGQS